MRLRTHLLYRHFQHPRCRMSTFTLPNTKPPVTVQLAPDVTESQLLSFPAFKIWLSTLQHSLFLQGSAKHEFNSAPYALRKIEVQAVDFFGRGRLGFVKLRADVSNDSGEKLPGSVFLRGGSVGILLILQPDDIPPDSDPEKRVILTIQPRIPAGSLAFPEIPAGMLDDSGTFSGGAAKEIQEETGLSIQQDELLDMTALTLGPTTREPTIPENEVKEKLQVGVYPSPGGSDEFIPLFLCQKRMKRVEIDQLQGQLTGLRKEGEKITLKLVPLEQLWKEGARDGKSLAAWALYNGLKSEGKI
ncbi:NUDIX family hydrolase [Coccidioides immitis RS]|uniref:NUDIX family hydrolase n=4 Tax=Coccidioides immitis TaxID=5501 RepID=J3K749_COCIM|nr:NUDIX family hydrolase [Coccidioides immitis RS]EAS30480.3 NUDIX family hydrolase [Coccidioides immitis RS]